jgi:POT family proton-dependent oligopeptide transporter
MHHPSAKPPSTLTLPWLAAVDFMERLSFFGMNAILVLYLTASTLAVGLPGPGMGYGTAAAAAVVGSYGALVFLTPLLGGWLADRLLGSSLAVLLGGCVITLGHGLMALPQAITFWIGLLAIALGTGLLKPNVTALVGASQGADQARRDAAFSLFYMCTNLGAFLAPLLVGSLAQARGWHWGFAAAGVAMALALALFVRGSQSSLWLPQPIQPLQPAELGSLFRRSVPMLAAVGALVGVHGLLGGFSPRGLALDLFLLVLVVAVVQLHQLWSTPALTPTQRRGVHGFVLVFVATVVFFMTYIQAGSVLITFAQQHANRHLGGWQLPTPWLMAVNPLGVIVFAPLFAQLWLRLGRRSPNAAVKFVQAFVLLALSLLLMVFPGFQADAGRQPTIAWVLVLLVLQTWAELLVMPVAMSTSSSLAPVGMEGRILALWYLSLSLGSALGGQLFALLGGRGLGPFFLSLTVVVSAITLLAFRLLPRFKPLLI